MFSLECISAAQFYLLTIALFNSNYKKYLARLYYYGVEYPYGLLQASGSA